LHLVQIAAPNVIDILKDVRLMLIDVIGHKSVRGRGEGSLTLSVPAPFKDMKCLAI
jgi:hypothetical protein